MAKHIGGALSYPPSQDRFELRIEGTGKRESSYIAIDATRIQHKPRSGQLGLQAGLAVVAGSLARLLQRISSHLAYFLQLHDGTAHRRPFLPLQEFPDKLRLDGDKGETVPEKVVEAMRHESTLV
jgi:hypothetical protein